jgi:hypothetical protein
MKKLTTVLGVVICHYYMSVLIIYYSVFVHEGGRFRFLSAFVVVFAQ